MLKRRIAYCFIFLLFISRSFAQVNLQTGSATFSLPMFNWQDDKSRLNSVVALSYNSGNGLKVNDIASNVGQGWNLIAGGVVTRMQVGEPDDQKAYGTAAENDIAKYPNGYLYATTPVSQGCPEALTKYPIYKNKNQVYKQHNAIAEDKQQDYFAFQFNGKAGMFVVMPGGNGYFLGDTKMKVTYQLNEALADGTYNGTRTTITSFTIQDIDGLIYKFSTHGKTRVLETNYSDDKVSQQYTQPKFDNGGVYYQAGFENTSKFKNSWVIGSWYLTEVEDALTHRKIIFNYNTWSINNIAGQDFVFYQTSDDDYCIITHKTSKTQTPEISRITYPDGHLVVFNYSGVSRVDFAGEQAMSSVDISYQNRFLSRYQLTTTYLIKNRYGKPITDDEKKYARLCLRSVQKIGVDFKEDTPPYQFDYYLGSSTAGDYIPAPFSWAKDVWGYYNGDNSKDLSGTSINLDLSFAQLGFEQIKGLCFLRSVTGTALNLNPKSGYAKNGLLRQIIYPTGGALSYQYIQNTGIFNGETTSNDVGGVHVSQTSSTDGGFSNGCANPIVTQYNYVLSNGSSSLWGIERPVNTASFTTVNHYAPEYKSYHWSWSCPIVGCCYYKFMYPGILSQNQSVSLSDFQKFMAAIEPVLGILSVVTTIMDVVTVACGSTGVLAWVAVIVDIIGNLVTVAITCWHDYSSNPGSNAFYTIDLNGSAPLPSQYKRVEVVENPGTIGKTVHEFTSSDDYPIWEPSNPNFTPLQRFAPWAYGLPKIVTVFDASGNKVKQTENKYDTYYAKTLIQTCGQQTLTLASQQLSSGLVSPLASYCPLQSCQCVVTDSYSQRNTDWSDPTKYNVSYLTSTTTGRMKVQFYNMYTGRVQLDTVYERVFKNNDPSQFVETYTKYFYNGSANYEVFQTTTKESNGNTVIKSIKYSSDFSVGILNTLVQNNIVALPVATSLSTSSTTSPNSGVLSEKVTEFIQLASGDVKPSRILEQRTSKPTSGIIYYQGPGSSTANYKITQELTYDANGNLVGLKDEGNRLVSNIYDYNDKYIVASVINADVTTDKPAYTSFETADISRSKWTLTGTATYNTISAVTGTQSLTLSAGKSLTASLNTAKAYTLSFWSSAALTVSAGATLIKSSPAISGFTYYEYNIAAGTATITVSGTGNVDELRVYPKMARMRTVTYDPLIGKTSECDENNRVTYYEYDNLGRMRFIKDDYKNVVKMYEYNNISPVKQNGCPTTYYNNLISEKFRRTNCSAGYLGGEVTYTVAANTFSSTISQADADAKAEYQLISNGNTYANTNGSCSFIYNNTAQSQSFTSETCANGYKGSTVTYTVPANRYTSLISVQDANNKALIEIAANGQTYANNNPACVLDTDPDWSWQDGDPSYCLSVNGTLPPHLFLFVKDLNPNSPTYNQTQWKDAGPQDACPAGNYYNSTQSAIFYKNNCSTGVGNPITYTVQPGTYSSTASQAAADQLAVNDINTNGQTFANTNGSCCTPTFTYSSTVTSSVTSSISQIGTTVYFTFVFTYPTGNSSFTIGNITSSCARPVSQRTIPYYIGNTLFNIVISSSGVVSLQLVSGTLPSGTVGISSKFDINLNAFYSAAKSGTYTRNNCPAGQVGSSVLYSVQQYKYASLISQPDADQQAQNDLNANGQNYANSSGTCSIPLTVTGTLTYSCAGTSPKSGSGTVTGQPGKTVTVNMGIYGGSASMSLTVIVNGSSRIVNGPSGSTSFDVVLPASGSMSWSASLNCSGSTSGGNYLTMSYK